MRAKSIAAVTKECKASGPRRVVHNKGLDCGQGTYQVQDALHRVRHHAQDGPGRFSHRYLAAGNKVGQSFADHTWGQVVSELGEQPSDCTRVLSPGRSNEDTRRCSDL